ncbi:S-adenosyl-L-methionine-dependent methyltransferase [Chytriomyces cf. hyalinus JEL632]|nr:S-adenosyl-L-methionine-dependent methyltransferase [Chytriomyces cf. hyalinus JEL632]
MLPVRIRFHGARLFSQASSAPQSDSRSIRQLKHAFVLRDYLPVLPVLGVQSTLDRPLEHTLEDAATKDGSKAQKDTRDPTKNEYLMHLLSLSRAFPLQVETAPLKVLHLSERGYGVCVAENGWLLLVPTVAVGEMVSVKPYRHGMGASLCELVQVHEKSKFRVEPFCKLHATCSGCSYQHLTYSYQLEHKENCVREHYAPLSLPDAAFLPIQESPKDKGVRTKLSPHHPIIWEDAVLDKIGFLERGRAMAVVDVENCPIATDAVNDALQIVRSRVIGSRSAERRLGATYQVRQTLRPISSNPSTEIEKTPKASKTMDLSDFVKRIKAEQQRPRASETPAAKPPTLASTLNLIPALSPIQPYPPSNMRAYPITSKTATVTDVVNGHILRSPSNAFYQNNSHILPHIIAHISSQLHQLQSKPSTLIDAYCGTGLFAITLAKLFKNVIGIELDRDSISWARQNALDNGLHDETVVRFISGDVSDLFQGAVESMVHQQLQHSKSMVNPQTIGDDIALVLDPPKKGCSLDFMHQVMRLNPAFIVYVSCNPASQVKDLQFMRNCALEGVPPASFKGSVGRLLKGEKEAGRVQSGLDNSRVLYLGGKKIVRNSGNGVAEVSVEDVDGSGDHVRREFNDRTSVAPVTLLKVKGYRVLNVKPFDMFPHSHRIEVVTTLIREDLFKDEVHV